MQKPKPEDYGYQPATLEDEGGWCIEGGEEAYYNAVRNYEAALKNRIIQDINQGYSNLVALVETSPDTIFGNVSINKYKLERLLVSLRNNIILLNTAVEGIDNIPDLKRYSAEEEE